jgi:pimeloyl-ACP methyl ester carboxylesterase
VEVDELGEGPSLLALPALSSVSSRKEMRPLAERLAVRFRVVVPDWPGFGTAPAPARPMRPADLQAFLAAFVAERFPSGPVPIVAAGHAAAYALDLAASRPGAVARLALVAPTWRGPLPTMAQGYKSWQATLRRLVEGSPLGPALYRLNVNRPMVRVMMKEHVLADPARLTPEFLAEKLEVTRRRNARFGTAAFVTGGLDLARSREAFLDLVRRAGVPVLAAWGPQTPKRSAAEMEALAALPGVIRAALPKGALGVHEEEPDAVAAATMGFLTGT